MSPEALPDWERLLAAERHNGDHVLEDLRPRFDEVLAGLEAAAGWQTGRVQRPVAILGRLDGVMTGLRQLRRTRPLESEMVSGLRIPTLAEMARIKAWLLATRNTVRDYLDVVVLLERLGEAEVGPTFASFDELYAQPSGASPMVEVVERLAASAPSDTAAVDLRTYKGIVAPWNDWSHLTARGRHWAQALSTAHLHGERP